MKKETIMKIQTENIKRPFHLTASNIYLEFGEVESRVYCLIDSENRCGYINYRTIRRLCNKYNSWHINDGEKKREYDFDFNENEPTLEGLDFLYVFERTIDNIKCEVCLIPEYQN